ncbi:MAG: hypothetical protein ACOYVF_11105 [Candidatus Zixiibacteriota bacterium]
MKKNRDNYPPIDLSRVRRYSIKKRPNKTETAAFGKPFSQEACARDFLKSLPGFLKAKDFKEFIDLTVKARRKGKPFHLLMGAHTIKVGLSPIIIDLMERSIVTGISFNGAGLVHDLELAFFGGTSEDVQVGLADGSFGMVKETSELYAAVVDLAAARRIGLGKAAGEFIEGKKARYRKTSLFAAAHRLSLTATLHIGIGTDIVNQHPDFNAARAAEASFIDFRVFSSVCEQINRGGVVANIGSAVILPEVFLKALTVARNLNRGKSRLTTANFDMLEHYRPRVNVVTRPTLNAGKGFDFRGHHEIMIPLLAWGLKASFR